MFNLGAGEIAVPLGEAFHSRRLRLVASQVGQVAPSHRLRWTHGRRLAAALALLDDPALDVLLAPAIDFAEPGGSTMERGGGHKEPMGPGEDSTMRAWVDDDGRIMALATHNNDTGDGWEREAYGQWYFETFSTRAYMLGTNIVIYAMTH